MIKHTCVGVRKLLVLYIKGVTLAQWLGRPRRSKQNQAFDP
jgi:hypothetical protein